MPIMPGTRELGPDNASLRIETKRGGAAAKAGHDLVIEVRSWQATLVIGEDPAESSLVLNADAGSMEVLEGTGGIMALTDEDRVEIKKTLEEEVIEPGPVEFRSTRMTPTEDGQHLEVSGELEMNGKTHPLDFELDPGTEGALSGTATLKQSDWGIEPYSGLFGTLKVKDQVEVVGKATLS
ncbi:MAG TPA: YceI family protein [Solirubrobacterales bacterium]|nr:YceI family protein [Solirubrobacterales bacterium]